MKPMFVVNSARRTTVRAAIVGSAVLLGCLVGLASYAFACLPQPLLSVSQQGGVSSGAHVVVNGVHFGTGTVELRWGALDGPLLASATGPSFAADVVIPKVDPGFYGLVGLLRNADGSVGNIVTQTGVAVGYPGLVARPATSGATTGKSSTSVAIPILLGVLVVAVVGSAWFVGTRSRRQPTGGSGSASEDDATGLAAHSS